MDDARAGCLAWRMPPVSKSILATVPQDVPQNCVFTLFTRLDDFGTNEKQRYWESNPYLEIENLIVCLADVRMRV